MTRPLHLAIAFVMAALAVFAGRGGDGAALLSLGVAAQAAAGGHGNDNGRGGDNGKGGGNGGGNNGGGNNGGNGGGNDNNGSGGGSIHGGGNAGGGGKRNSSGGGPLGAPASPASQPPGGMVARDSAIANIKAYREAVLENDIAAAASALAAVKTEISVSEIEQINEILGLNSETTSLTVEDILNSVREIASRQQ